MKARPAANAPPARSFAQLPPIAKANNRWRLPIIPQPIWAIMFPTSASHSASLIKGSELPILTIKPAAGITAITTIRHLPNFCQNSKLSIFFILILLQDESYFYAKMVGNNRFIFAIKNNLTG